MTDLNAQIRMHSTGVGAETVNLYTLRDKYGFLWIGTTTGLACFDGNGVPTNRNVSGIIRSTANLRVNTIFEHGDNIWFATPTQLMVFDRKENRTYRFPYKTKYGVEISANVYKIIQSDADRVWIITQGQGFFIYNEKEKTLEQDSRHGSFFTDAEIGSDGSIFIAGIDGKIQKFTPSGKFLASYSIPEYVPNKSRIFMERDGDDLWLTSGSDIYVLNSNGEISRRHSTVTAGAISDIINTGPGRFILGTPSGLMTYDIHSNSSSPIDILYSQEGSSPFDSRVTQLAKDSDGNIIVVSRVGDLNILSAPEATFKFIEVPSPYSAQNFVYSVCGSTDGTGLWIGSDNGINYYDIATGLLTYPNIPGLGSEAISSITTQGDKLWIGTAQNGLILYDSANKTSRRFHYEDDVPYTLMSDEITDVFISSTGEIFVLTQWGICRFDPEKSAFYTLPEMGQQTHVITIAEDNDGGIWAATVNNGLFYRKAGEARFESFKSKALDKSTVTIMLLGRNGMLWVATQEDGIFYFDKTEGDFKKFNIPLLFNKSISAMEEDSEGALWIVCGKAIIKISKDGKPDFNLSRILFRTPVLRASTSLPNGYIAIGCSDGVQFFSPSAMGAKNGSVSAMPSGITFPFMNNDDESLQSLGVNVLLYTKDKITLPYDHNTFTIHLAANHPADLPSVSYDYMLEGIDKNWTVGVAQSEVTYNNIPPGTYHFLVKPSGMPDADATVLTIKISPPWYLSIWAYIAYTILLIIIGIAIWFIVRKSVRNHYNRRIDSLRAQKEREIWQAKMKFFVDLVHEIRTPLMLISVPLEYLSNKFKTFQNNKEQGAVSQAVNNDIKSSHKYLMSMQNNLDYLLGITNQILDFRQIENEDVQISLSISACNLNQTLILLCKRFEDPMEAEGKEIILQLPDSEVTAYIDADKTERVLMNLVGNARKYCKKKVLVTLQVIDDKAMVSISDDGDGVPENERINIFDRYYQIKDDKIATSLGTGLGLAYAKRISQLHKGDINIGDSEFGGAMFTLILPLGSAEDISDSVSHQIAPEAVADGKQLHPEIPMLSDDDIIGKDNTVLVVDDNDELLDMVCEGLETSYNVIRAHDGVEALEILKDNEIDFIVSDVMMPRMDGIELLHNVKSDINTSHIPFIILTAKTSAEARAEGMQQGADIYLDKPFSISNLIMQIENMRRTRNFFFARRRGSEPLPDVEEAVMEAVKEEKLPAINKYDAEFLSKLNSLMEENISDEEFTIDILAENLNMSRSSFYRKLKALMGMTPVDYMKNYRLDVAARQLREGARVTEVVTNIGFTSSSYFAKCFKDKYGVLPRDYVASLK